MNTQQELVLLSSHGAWNLHGSAAARFSQANDFLGYLSDRNYSSATTRAYGYDLLAFCRWLHEQNLTIEAVDTNTLIN
ncbi:site-specific integrase, partial [Glutamicibacter bergerei]